MRVLFSNRFVRNEDGAIRSDWVFLGIGALVLGVASIGIIQGAAPTVEHITLAANQ